MKKNADISADSQSQGPTIQVGQININVKDFNNEPDLMDLPILPTRNLVLFPDVHLSIGLGREISVKVAEYAESTHSPIGIVCQLHPEYENPAIEDLYSHGVIADVFKVLEMPDGTKTALVRARERFIILGPGAGKVLPDALSVSAEISPEIRPRKNDMEFRAVVDNIRQLSRATSSKSPEMSALITFDDNTSPAEIIHVTATNIPIPVEDKFRLISENSLKKRAIALMASLKQYDDMLDVRNEVMTRARHGMEENQRNAFLQMQMDTIREELYGDETSDADTFMERIAAVIEDENLKKILTKEVDKLRRYNPQSPDYAVQYSYLDLVLGLPWKSASPLNADFTKAEKTLNADHFGLEKVKERIIEQLAVLMDNPHVKAPILCLVGPPGVGKTSIGSSIARSLGRKYQRVALGGVHDEAEIRGHRRTYIGAMPGRVIDAMRRAAVNNPVLLLDELDKLSRDIKGDPSAALLEVLDPEQNCHFHDNYVDVDFDLSKVLFVATANTTDTIPRPLLDRIEVVEIPGYVPAEKLEIAKRHLIPRMVKEQGWRKNQLKISDEAIMAIIDDYTAESGVRQLEKLLAKILRKAVLAKLRKTKFPSPVKPENLRDLLGIAPYHRDKPAGTDVPGVVTGLAWTQVGGETLLVEVAFSPAKTEGKLTLTGNLGDVMKESATIALEWIKSNADKIGIDRDRIATNNIHIHFPEGAVPKDGPSAGITIVTAIVSALKGQPVRPHLAMTGEATLRGSVLPVGGIREKLLAAKRAGVTDIIISSENRRNVEDIPAEYLQGVTFHYVDTLHDVLQAAF